MDEATKGLPYKNNCSIRPPLLPLALNNPTNSKDDSYNNYRNNRNMECMGRKKDRRKDTYKKIIEIYSLQ
jgi:hypothetical protein